MKYSWRKNGGAEHEVWLNIKVRCGMKVHIEAVPIPATGILITVEAIPVMGIFWSHLPHIHSSYSRMASPSPWLFVHRGNYEVFGYENFFVGYPTGQNSSCCIVLSRPRQHHQYSRGAVWIRIRHDGGRILPLCGQPRHLDRRVGAVQDRVSAVWRPQPMPCKMYAPPKAVVGWVAFWVGQKW